MHMSGRACKGLGTDKEEDKHAPKGERSNRRSVGRMVALPQIRRQMAPQSLRKWKAWRPQSVEIDDHTLAQGQVMKPWS